MAEVERLVEAGELPQDVIDDLQQLDGFMQAGKHKEAEELLDDALVALGIDHKTLAKKPANGAPLQPGASAAGDPLEGVLYYCDGNHATAVAVHRDRETAQCTIPKVGLGAVLVISSQGQRR